MDAATGFGEEQRTACIRKCSCDGVREAVEGHKFGDGEGDLVRGYMRMHTWICACLHKYTQASVGTRRAPVLFEQNGREACVEGSMGIYMHAHTHTCTHLFEQNGREACVEGTDAIVVECALEDDG